MLRWQTADRQQSRRRRSHSLSNVDCWRFGWRFFLTFALVRRAIFLRRNANEWMADDNF